MTNHRIQLQQDIVKTWLEDLALEEPRSHYEFIEEVKNKGYNNQMHYQEDEIDEVFEEILRALFTPRKEQNRALKKRDEINERNQSDVPHCE